MLKWSRAQSLVLFPFYNHPIADCILSHGFKYHLCSDDLRCVQPQEAWSEDWTWGKKESSGCVFPQISLSEETRLVSIASPSRADSWPHTGFGRSKKLKDWWTFGCSSGLASSVGIVIQQHCYWLVASQRRVYWSVSVPVWLTFRMRTWQ